MRIAITGSTGDIGGSFLRFASREHATQTLTRHQYSPPELHVFTDCDAVVHIAGILNDPHIGFNEYFAVNTLLTAQLAAVAARQPKQPHFVYISSEMIYKLGDRKALNNISKACVAFCQKAFSNSNSALTQDFGQLADEFVQSYPDLPLTAYDPYSLTKYLGEVVAQHFLPTSVLRVSNAYGPDYQNMRLLPRLMKGRLDGRGADYLPESRHFIYSQDLNACILRACTMDAPVTVDCRGKYRVSVSKIADDITQHTPTAYGILQKQQPIPTRLAKPAVPPPKLDATAFIGKLTSFAIGFEATLLHHREQCYHTMVNHKTIHDFLAPTEKIVRELNGSSAAYLYLVKDTVTGSKRVRKVAYREGVEGNGIVKVANEIAYYQHIAKDMPNLAKLYPRIYGADTKPDYSSEVIEYIDGLNTYQELQSGRLPQSEYIKSVKTFLNKLCRDGLSEPTIVEDPYLQFTSYYLERAFSRLKPIESLIETQNGIVINGQRFMPAEQLLSTAFRNPDVAELLSPRVEYNCFHGDLTFLNSVFEQSTNTIRLIDPRGYIGQWDPLYDFAKLRFSLSGFGELIEGKLPLVEEISPNSYLIHFQNLPPDVLYTYDHFYELLSASRHFEQKIVTYEPNWQERIAFAEAIHYLSDIPFRLYTDGGTQTAIASYVLGTYYLNAVYKTLCLSRQTSSSKKAASQNG